MQMVPNHSSARNASEKTYSLPIPECAFIAGGVEAAFYIAFGLAFDVFIEPTLVPAGTPRLSTGQQFGMMIFLAALLGAGAGASIAFAFRSSWWCAGASVSIAGLVIAAVSAGLWTDKVNRYGADPSDDGLYFPLLVASLPHLLFGMALTFLAVVLAIRRRLRAHAPTA
jgi:hypothetical protein